MANRLYVLVFIFCSNSCIGQFDYLSKTKGLLYGTLIGDALGGPIEFQMQEDVIKTGFPIKIWTKNDSITEAELINAKNRIAFRGYSFLRPYVESYAQWKNFSLPGTVTDDSRNKMVLMHMLRTKIKKSNKVLTESDMAQAYISWASRPFIKNDIGYDTLSALWLKEINYASNWVLKNKDTAKRPPERMWNALPTCWGQMTTTPLAAIYPEDTLSAYNLAYSISFFDNAFARDMNAALVAGLAKAYSIDPSKMSNEDIWKSIISTMQNTDPYQYQKVPWSSRAINRWLALADTMATKSNGKPAILFEQLNQAFLYNEKWEAHVPIAVCFSILKMCKYDPLAALQMSIEWGWDTDTYPQLLGAFIGAIYGENIFKEEWKSLIKTRLKIDYDEDVDEWSETLLKYKLEARKKKVYKIR